jgi:hypothetical protein
MIVMPNHFHCIIENVGADTQVCPDMDGQSVENENGQSVENGQTRRSAPTFWSKYPLHLKELIAMLVSTIKTAKQ